MRTLTFVQAVNEALREEMRRDPTVYILGESVRATGGVFRTTTGLMEEFGEERVLDTPLSETVIAGSSVGAAMAGYRPVADMMLADFMFVAMDEICSKAAKWGYMNRGEHGMTLPLVIRAAFGGYTSSSAEHSQSPLAYFWHTPGLKIVVPTTPYDAKGLLKTAIRDPNPVLVFEHKLLFRSRLAGPVPEEEYTIPFGEAAVRREGSDVTVVAIGYQVVQALEAAERLAQEGIEVEVIDPRTLEPLDINTIVQSVEKTSRLVVVDEGVTRCGSGAEICMQVIERAFNALDAPPRRVGAANTPIPYSPPLEQAVLPKVDDIITAIKATL